MEGLSSRVGRVAAVCHPGPITLIGRVMTVKSQETDVLQQRREGIWMVV
jgi:hypothetical protein